MSIELKVASLPNQALAYNNAVYLHFDDFMSLVTRTPKGVTTKAQVKACGLNICLNDMVFAAKPLKEIEQGNIGMGSLQRQSANLSMNQAVEASVFVPKVKSIALSSVTFELQLLVRGQIREAKIIDCEALSGLVASHFLNQVFTIGQVFAVDFSGIPMRLKVNSVLVVKANDTDPDSRRGQFITGSTCTFTKARDTPIKLTKQSSGGGNRIFKPDFDFSKLGIGGLDKEFNDIFRRAFASRVFPAEVVQKMGINHVRGMLLFGPPGCGKTLIARQIGKVLNSKEPKVVNGPEILDKFVGESERKIRDLFADARQDQEENGEESELHIIIFDEIDAVCKARGSSRDGTGVGDSVVNQLLTQIDGVDSLNNVLVIGMTNRKDMLDEALLRPGRLEVQMEINLPDEKGRGQILKIHTSKARNNGFLSDQVLQDIDSCIKMTPLDRPNLAQRTKNFSGAEIEGLVRAATAHALSRGTDGKTFHALQNFKPSILPEDFDLALEEVKPKFGSPKDGLEHLYRNGIIDFGTDFRQVQDTLNTIIAQVKNNDRTSLMSIMLHGDAGAGKTALAAHAAVASEFPLVRLISAADFIGMGDASKCGKIYQTFQEAYRSPFSIIIIDDIERVLDYVAVGPRFSNPVLQALMVMIKNPPPVPERKLLVIGITSVIDEMQDLGLVNCFDMDIEIPKLKPRDIKTVLKETQVPIGARELDEIVATFGQPIAIKKLLLVVEMVRQDSDEITCEKFVDCVYKFKL